MTPPPLEIVRTAADARARIRAWQGAGLCVGLVPTMGALHAGHLALVARALADCDRVVVTVFVNPRQFGPNEDLASYPRTEAEDAVKLEDAGAHLLYAPGAGEVYPPGDDFSVAAPAIGAGLEGVHRPGFFDGVATVVARLFDHAPADRAYFGEKDYQQLCVVRRMVADRAIPIEIVACETVREADGLALSSRNAYLDAAERAIAPALHRQLCAVAEAVAGGEDVAAVTARATAALQADGFGPVDYVAVCDAATLAPVEGVWDGERSLRVLAAARLGPARLIDNIAVPARASGGHAPDGGPQSRA